MGQLNNYIVHFIKGMTSRGCDSTYKQAKLTPFRVDLGLHAFSENRNDSSS